MNQANMLRNFEKHRGFALSFNKQHAGTDGAWECRITMTQKQTLRQEQFLVKIGHGPTARSAIKHCLAK